MNKHSESKEYILVSSVEQMGEEPFSRWPLHMTVVPWFELPDPNLSETDLVLGLSQYLNKYNSSVKESGGITATVGKKVMFGPDLPVMLVEPKEKLTDLHLGIITELGRMGVGLADDTFCHEHYQPHITVRGDRSIATGTKFNIEELALVKIVSEKPMLRQKVADIRIG